MCSKYKVWWKEDLMGILCWSVLLFVLNWQQWDSKTGFFNVFGFLSLYLNIHKWNENVETSQLKIMSTYFSRKINFFPQYLIRKYGQGQSSCLRWEPVPKIELFPQKTTEAVLKRSMTFLSKSLLLSLSNCFPILH